MCRLDPGLSSKPQHIIINRTPLVRSNNRPATLLATVQDAGSRLVACNLLSVDAVASDLGKGGLQPDGVLGCAGIISQRALSSRSVRALLYRNVLAARLLSAVVCGPVLGGTHGIQEFDSLRLSDHDRGGHSDEQAMLHHTHSGVQTLRKC